MCNIKHMRKAAASHTICCRMHRLRLDVHIRLRLAFPQISEQRRTLAYSHNETTMRWWTVCVFVCLCVCISIPFVFRSFCNFETQFYPNFCFLFSFRFSLSMFIVFFVVFRFWFSSLQIWFLKFNDILKTPPIDSVFVWPNMIGKCLQPTEPHGFD